MKISIVLLYCLFNSALGGPHERRLLKHLFVEQRHNKLERPAEIDSEPVSVSMQFYPQEIVDFNKKSRILTIRAWLTLFWRDYSMSWTSEDYGHITTIRVPDTKIWIPDIVLSNSLDKECNSPRETNVVIQSTGDVVYVTQKIFTVSCKTNGTSFVSVSISCSKELSIDNISILLDDIYSCSLQFGSWSFDSFGINLTLSDPQINLTTYTENIEWDLKNTSVILHSISYPCCVEVYPNIEYTLQIAERSPINFANINGTEKQENQLPSIQK